MMMAAMYLSGGVNITMTNRMPITIRDKRAGRIVSSLSRMWLISDPFIKELFGTHAQPLFQRGNELLLGLATS